MTEMPDVSWRLLKVVLTRIPSSESGELLIGDELGHRVGAHLEPLSEQDLDPAFLGEQLLRVVLEEPARGTKQLEPLLQAVGNVHGPDMVPERIATAPGHLVMGND